LSNEASTKFPFTHRQRERLVSVTTREKTSPLKSRPLTYANKMASEREFRPARSAPALAIVGSLHARTVGTANSSVTFGRQCTVRGKGIRGGRRSGETRGTMVCTAVGRWVRSVSTVRELDRASGPLVGPVPTRLHTYAHVYAHAHAHARERTAASLMHRHRAAARCIALLHECAPCNRSLARERAHACPRDCVRVRATRSRFRSVFARRGASPSVAASRPAKILARSVCSLASFPLPPRAARSSEGPASPLARRAPSPRLAFPFLRFSHSAKRSPYLVFPSPTRPPGSSRGRSCTWTASLLPREESDFDERQGRGERWSLLTTVAN